MLLDGQTYEIIYTIQIYVRPVHIPVLSRFCISLTGISPETVCAAVEFPAALKTYMRWVASHNLFRLSPVAIGIST